MNFNITRKECLIKKVHTYTLNERDCMILAIPVNGYYSMWLFSYNILPGLRDNS